ncbi:MAG: hypothetical protein ACOCTN_02920 [Candidatus Natronoplasma sp.]
MELKELEKGSLKVIEGSDHRPVSSLAVKVVSCEGKNALIMDGSQTVNPYFMIRECKKAGLNEREVLKKINISRAFTAYQFMDLIIKGERKLKKTDTAFLGTVALSSVFEDDEVREEEGRWMRYRVTKKIRRLVREKDLYGVIVDSEVEIFKQRSVIEKSSKENKHKQVKALI